MPPNMPISVVYDMFQMAFPWKDQCQVYIGSSLVVYNVNVVLNNVFLLAYSSPGEQSLCSLEFSEYLYVGYISPVSVWESILLFREISLAVNGVCDCFRNTSDIFFSFRLRSVANGVDDVCRSAVIVLIFCRVVSSKSAAGGVSRAPVLWFLFYQYSNS